MERIDLAPENQKQQDSDSFAQLDREINTCLTYSTGAAGMKSCEGHEQLGSGVE